MNPALIALVFSLIEELIKIEPALAAEISTLFANGNPTPADWAALRAKVLGEDFAALAPNAAANLAPAPAPAVEAPAPAPEVASTAAPEAAPVSHTRADGTTVLLPQ